MEICIEELKKFAVKAFEENYHVYAVTLTYSDFVNSKSDGSRHPIELPSQKYAINCDMDNFKDRFRKGMKKRGIIFKCFFIYSQPDGERPHFHGFIATSKAIKVNYYIKEYWVKGKIYDSPKVWTWERLYGWIEYCRYNIENSYKNYLPGYQFKSVTRNSGESKW